MNPDLKWVLGYVIRIAGVASGILGVIFCAPCIFTVNIDKMLTTGAADPTPMIGFAGVMVALAIIAISIPDEENDGRSEERRTRMR